MAYKYRTIHLGLFKFVYRIMVFAWNPFHFVKLFREAKSINPNVFVRNTTIRCHPCWKPIHFVYAHIMLNAFSMQHATLCVDNFIKQLCELALCSYWYALKDVCTFGFGCKLKSIYLSSIFEQYICDIESSLPSGSHFAWKQSYWNTETMYYVPGIVCPATMMLEPRILNSNRNIQWNNVLLKCFHVSGLVHIQYTRTRISTHVYR